MENDERSTPQDDSRFMQLVAMFQLAALQQMGKLANPMSGEVERDLAQAKASIDMVEMLKKKTAGNLSGGENEFLDKILFELHMNYVDEVDRAAREEKEKEKEKEEPGQENGTEQETPDTGSREESGAAEEKDTESETD